MDSSNVSWLGPSCELSYIFHTSLICVIPYTPSQPLSTAFSIIQHDYRTSYRTTPNCLAPCRRELDPTRSAPLRLSSARIRGCCPPVVILYAAALILRIETRGDTFSFLRLPLSLRGILRGPLDDLQNHAALVSLSCVQRFIQSAKRILGNLLLDVHTSYAFACCPAVRYRYGGIPTIISSTSFAIDVSSDNQKLLGP
jgi:hypothetical protein